MTGQSIARQFLTRATSLSFAATIQKKPALRVKWADHFGGSLADSHAVEGEEGDHDPSTDSNVSWSDRKKRDRMREKELLAKAK